MKAILFISLFTLSLNVNAWESMPSHFENVKNTIPSIEVDLRYTSKYNFTGQLVVGYSSNICYLQKKVIKKLKKVQNDLLRNNLSLKLYDCYRPQASVDSFVKWANADREATHKLAFHPNIKKNMLFKKNYIAKNSKHSKGIAIDLTIVKTKNIPSILFIDEKQKDCTKTSKWPKGENTIEMGTTYDCLDSLSNTESPYISATALANRRLLKKYMKRQGFKNYSKEWWHYTLPEANSNKYYNFEIK